MAKRKRGKNEAGGPSGADEGRGGDEEVGKRAVSLTTGAVDAILSSTDAAFVNNNTLILQVVEVLRFTPPPSYDQVVGIPVPPQATYVHDIVLSDGLHMVSIIPSPIHTNTSNTHSTQHNTNPKQQIYTSPHTHSSNISGSLGGL